MNKGKFIVFEGLDGCGSSTHSDVLTKRLLKENISVAQTQEPTDNVLGGALRGALTKEWSIPKEGLQLLFSADRSHHIHRFIEPNINKGTNVICDRYMYSTFAYGSLNIPDIQWLKDMNKFFLVPDIVVLLKVSPKECIRRIHSTRAEVEMFEEVKQLEKIWQEYQKLANENNNFVIIDADRPKDEVAEDVYNEVKKILR